MHQDVLKDVLMHAYLLGDLDLERLLPILVKPSH